MYIYSHFAPIYSRFNSPAIFGNSNVDDEVAGVRHVDMKVGRPMFRVECVTVRDVHLRTEVRPHKEIGHTRGQIVLALPPRVVGERDAFHEVIEPIRQVRGEVVIRRPILELEQHAPALFIHHPGGEILEAVPEHFKGDIRDGLARHGIDDGVLDVAKLLGEGVRTPKVLDVQLARDVGHDHRLAADPLFLLWN